MGLTVIIAVIGHSLFYRTGIPESIFMILLGLTLGPLTGVIEANNLSNIITHIFTLSIIIILLESGLTTDINEAFETMRTSTLFTFTVLMVTSILCGGFLYITQGWSIYASLILGVICSGTSTLPILYYTSRMKLNPAVNQMLIFESVINDVTIITAVSLIIQAINLELNPSKTIISIVQYLLVATILGVSFSTIWTLVLSKIREELSLSYLSTLAISIILYSITEATGGSGVISVMVFGVTMGNLPEHFRKRLSIRRKVSRFFTQIEVMQDEVTFLVKNTFFFVLGLMFNPQTITTRILIIALLLTGLMIASRWISYKTIGHLDKRYIYNTQIVSLMVSRGLTAGLTAFMPTQQGIEIPPITDIVIVMILFTNLAAILGFMIYNKSRKT
jgi:cell volume regulation protein A